METLIRCHILLSDLGLHCMPITLQWVKGKLFLQAAANSLKSSPYWEVRQICSGKCDLPWRCNVFLSCFLLLLQWVLFDHWFPGAGFVDWTTKNLVCVGSGTCTWDVSPSTGAFQLMSQSEVWCTLLTSCLPQTLMEHFLTRKFLTQSGDWT